MSQYQRPIGELKKFAKQFQGVLALVPLLENLDTLENEEKEKLIQVKKLREQVSAGKKQIDTISKTQEEAAWIATKLIKDAKDKAKSIEDDARERAEEVRAFALKDLDREKQGLSNEILLAKESIRKSSQKLLNLGKELEEREEKLRVTNKELERLRSIL